MRILFAVIGSLGDLHPCLALALELRRRGHRVTIASTTYYQHQIEALGIQFHPMRPHWDPTDNELIGRCENIRSGVEVLFRNIVLPELRDTFEDLLSAALHADLMLSGDMVFAAPLVAEKLALPWASIVLSPASFLSAHDPSILVNAPGLIHLRKAGWRTYRAATRLARLSIHSWWKPVRALRRQIGISPGSDPLFHDKFSPRLVLALFSPQLAQPQPDWPASTIQPGFVFYDPPAVAAPAIDAPMGAKLSDFLAAGEPPIVFTLGSTAVNNPGNFYDDSAMAAKLVGRRCVLLVGKNPVAVANSHDVLILPYAPYAQIFPHAAVIVHQGGSGTTAQAMRAGRPMLIVPYGWDQPDNGARIARRGLGLCLERRNYSAESAASCLQRILSNPASARNAQSIRETLHQENALATAADAIESLG